ncbi:uncharacterized protein [Choristoneura fumiferana]|uniref:uncharacterized protein n=1 Tax=Choristoneura fumiferana TaxID=7141 RepID=UPI003D1571FB
MLTTLLLLTVAIHGIIGTENSLYHNTHSSTRTNGFACFGDCINNQCVYDWAGHTDTCHESPVVAPVYKTIKNKDCYSNCGRYNYEPFNWCATLEDSSIKWEKCTRYEANTATRQIQTNNYLYTCKDDCAKRGSSYHWCNTYNSWEKCDPENWILVFNYPTEKFNDVCATPCVLYSGERKCYDLKEKWVSCYLNPDKSLILFQFGQNIFKAIKYYGELSESSYEVCSDSSFGSKRKRAINSQWPFITSVRDLVAELESGFPTIFLHDGGAVQSYTVLPIPNPGMDDTIIPLAIRAVITQAHLRPPGTRGNIPSAVTRNIARMNPYVNRLDGNNDERGHLLASAIGGAMEPYNFIPQPMSFNRGRGSRWYFLERLIARFLRAVPGRYVEWQMALNYDVYSDRPYRPISINLNVRMYEPDGSMNDTSGVYENMFFSNNPLWACRTFFTGNG